MKPPRFVSASAELKPVSVMLNDENYISRSENGDFFANAVIDH
jgi:hypothetical protein